MRMTRRDWVGDMFVGFGGYKKSGGSLVCFCLERMEFFGKGTLTLTLTLTSGLFFGEDGVFPWLVLLRWWVLVWWWVLVRLWVLVQWWVCGSMVAVGGLVVASVFGCCGGRHRGKKEEREE